MNAFLDVMHQLADGWWGWVVQAGWQSSVVGCAVLVLIGIGRRWPSTVCYWLLVLGLLKFAMPPLWSTPLGVFGYVRVDRGMADDATEARIGPPQAPTAPMHRSPTSVHGRDRSPSERGLANRPPATTAQDFSADSTREEKLRDALAEGFAPHRKRNWKSLLMAVHFIGLTAVLAWAALQFTAVRRIVANSRGVTAGPILESMRRMEGRTRVGRSIRVLTSDDVKAPLAVGILRPTVVIPRSAEHLSARQLDAVLLHEFTHVQRGDAWLASVEILLCAAWWFHPVIWLVHRNLRRVREDCCDDRILLSGVSTASDYCDTLLRVARDSAAGRTEFLACHMAERLHPLGKRLRRIMDPRVRRSPRMTLRQAAIVAILATVLLPGIGVSSNPPERAQPNLVHGEAPLSIASNPPQPAAQTPAPVTATRPTASAVRLRAWVGKGKDESRFSKRIRHSIASGRALLLKQQNQDGSIGTVLGRGSYRVGPTALALLAVLGSGLDGDDPAVAAGLKYLRNARQELGTYELSLVLMALVTAKKWEQDQAILVALARKLEDSQTKDGPHSGMWNYGRLHNMGSGTEDNSNTQFAILALREAARCKIPVKLETWKRTARHFATNRNSGGGWGYQNGMKSTGSMTCSGVICLTICERMLSQSATARGADGKSVQKSFNREAVPQIPEKKRRGDDSDNSQARPSVRIVRDFIDQAATREELECETAIREGLTWLDGHFVTGSNPGQGTTWVLYYAWDLANVGRLTGIRALGNRDWYGEIATMLIDAQSRSDGGWHESFAAERDSVIATSFSLLFLCKGLEERGTQQ
jgi:beta-lactamase regulating signal transducer with metallopeptidase domain